MKKFKKMVAVATATVLALTPMTAFADTDTEKTATGSGAVENDNSTAPSYDSVVLPTVGTNTFDFTLDPGGLLHEYDPATYTTTDTLLFKSEAYAPTLSIDSDDATTDGKLYKKTYVELSSVNDILADLQIADTSNATVTFIASPSAEYYVWTPKADGSGQGEYTKLTDSNLRTYVKPDITYSTGTYGLGSTAEMENPKLSTSASNGKIYKLVYAEITDSKEAATYVTYSGSAITAIKDGLFKKMATDGTYVQVNKDTDSAILVYSSAITTYQNDSDVIKIENKSTKAKTVTVTLKVTNSEGLTFTDDANFKKADPENEGQQIADNDSMVYLAVTDGTTPSAVKVGSDGVATITGTYQLAAPTGTVLTYMDKNDIESSTGSHTYKQYENNDIGYSSVSLHVTGEANANADWDAYIKALKDYTPDPDADPADPTDIRPGIEVVYTISDAIVATASLNADNTTKLVIDGLRSDANASGTITTQGTADGHTNLNTVLASSLTWDTTNWTEADGGQLIVIIGAEYAPYYAGETVTIGIPLNNGATITTTITYPAQG